MDRLGKKVPYYSQKEEEPIFSVDVLHDEDGFAKFNGGWTNQNTRPRLVGDIDGDGRADIVGFGYNTVFSDRLNSSSEWDEKMTIVLTNRGLKRGTIVFIVKS